MASHLDDPSVERFAARRATGWRQRDGTVMLDIEAVREPDAVGIAAILAGARLDNALERAELTISVLESGAVRLQVGSPPTDAPGLLDEDELLPVPLSATTAEGTLRLASERHGGYGPDPEDLTVEITLEPLGLSILDAGGKTIARLASVPPNEPHQPGVAPFAWLRWTDATGEARRALTVSLALDADERLFGLGQQTGPLNLVGQTVAVLPLASADGDRPRPPFLLSGHGYGLLIHTASGLTADLGAGSASTLTVDGPSLDVLILPSTWPRTALATYSRLTGRAPAPAPAAFQVDANAIAPPASVEAMLAALRAGLTYGLSTPGYWLADPGPAPDGPVFPALLARWAQIAMLSPLAGATAPLAGARSQTDPFVRSVVLAYAALRSRLLPYLLHCARETAQTGLPMLRPMLLEFSWDPDAVEIEDQFLLGRDLLVAPVFSESPDLVTRRVYLPAYANWYDWWTGTLYEGKQWVETTAPLERVPLYVRAGTVIPVADPGPDGGNVSADVTRLLLFAPRDGAIGASVEYGEDDLLGVEQERGERKARVFIEGIPGTIRDLEMVGLPASAHLVDASAPSIALVPGDGILPGLGGHWASLIVRLAVGAFTAGLELGW